MSKACEKSLSDRRVGFKNCGKDDLGGNSVQRRLGNSRMARIWRARPEIQTFLCFPRSCNRLLAHAGHRLRRMHSNGRRHECRCACKQQTDDAENQESDASLHLLSFTHESEKPLVND